MTVVPHEYGAFAGRAGKNVFTIKDFDDAQGNPIQKLASVTTQAQSTGKSVNSHQTSCFQVARAALELIGLVAAGTLLAIGVGSGLPFILTVVIVAVLSVLCVCHLAYAIKNSNLCAHNDVKI